MTVSIQEKKRGVLVGGSGLIGGALMHYFKTRTPDIEVLSPNSKKLSLREPADIQAYFDRYQPDFIINAAIAAIDSDAHLAFEVNYLGALRLARLAIERRIPYIHFSTAATLPPGEDLREEDVLPLSADLANYPKSKLMADHTLAHLHRSEGLDYTTLRLGVVYGKHDHKIQGFHRLLFSIADEAMPVLLTRRGVRHSYTHCKKIPPFVHYLLEHRQEFSGRVIHFVDPEPVALDRLILTIKSYLNVPVPRRVYVPYPLARLGKVVVGWLVRRLAGIGIETRMPAELLFLEHFYKSQTLSARRLLACSYQDPFPDVTVFSRLPELIEYYIARWEHLNLITSFNPDRFDPRHRVDAFVNDPQGLLERVHQRGGELPALYQDPCSGGR